MKRKILGIFVCMLLLMTMGLPCINGNQNQKNATPQIHDPISAPTDWWPMFGHDLIHSRYSTSPAPDSNISLWSYSTGDSVFSSPAIADGKIYIGSFDRKVYCLDATTGEHLWNYTTGLPVYSSPAVADGKVYVGSTDDKVYCLDALTGAQVWNYTTEVGYGGVYSSPAVANGKVYIGSNDHKVYCLNATTGAQVWNYTTGSSVFPCTAVADGKVYVGSNDHKVYCLDAMTGKQSWNYTTGNLVVSSPAVADGKAYIGSEDGKVYCLNATTGAQVWNYTTGSYIESSPAVANGKVYIGSNDHKVYCLNATTGMQSWNYTTGSSVFSSPAVADGKVYIGSNDDKVYCLNATTGGLIWNNITGDYVESSPAVADGKVYVGSDDKKVYCFGSTNTPSNVTVNITKPVAHRLYFNDNNGMKFPALTIVYGQITITATAMGSAGIKNATFSIDGTPVQNFTGAGPYSYLWDANVKGLRHTIKVVAFDNNGSTGSAQINIIKWKLHIIPWLIVGAVAVSLLIPHTTMKGLVLNLHQNGVRGYTFFALRMHFHTVSLFKNVRGVVTMKRCVVRFAIPPMVILKLGPPRTLAYLSVTFLGSTSTLMHSPRGVLQNLLPPQGGKKASNSMFSSFLNTVKNN